MCAFFKNIYSNHCNRKKFVFFFLSLARREREREREIGGKPIINCKNNLLTKNKNNNKCVYSTKKQNERENH
jgi:hypothetical protein